MHIDSEHVAGGHDHAHEHEHEHTSCCGHDHSEEKGFCPCGHDAVSNGVGHDRAMGRIFFALLGGLLTVNSFLLDWLLPEQTSEPSKASWHTRASPQPNDT